VNLNDVEYFAIFEFYNNEFLLGTTV